MSTILVVDDEANVRGAIAKVLASLGHKMLTAASAVEALEHLKEWAPELVVMDVQMPGMSGLDAIRKMKEIFPRLPIIMMTGQSTTETAIEATKNGAFDYHLKPFEPQEMIKSINHALESIRLMAREVEIAPAVQKASADALIGQSPAMQEVYKAIGRVAATDATVLIRGETGTGKELVARALYQHSGRNALPLMVVNCVAIPETLLESELFGHERGAFTGASLRRIGKFEQAHRGTIFLDEIGDVPLSIQGKILRVLQEKTFDRVGSNDPVRVDVRVLAATNRNLEKGIKDGTFREDLYHRLNVVTVDIPSLRERSGDIKLLSRYFMDKFARELHYDHPIISEPALAALQAYHWPGNVRELEHCIQRALIFTRGFPIHPEDVRQALERPTDIPGAGSQLPPEERCRELIKELVQHAGQSGEGNSYKQIIEMVDRMLITEALRMTNGNQTHAARNLGLTRPTLQAKMQKYQIHRSTQISE